jgi:hypothetical protein
MAPPESVLGMPSQRPNEPLQAGMGPEMPGGPQFNDALFDLREMARAYPEYARQFSRLIALAEEQA